MVEDATGDIDGGIAGRDVRRGNLEWLKADLPLGPVSPGNGESQGQKDQEGPQSQTREAEHRGDAAADLLGRARTLTSRARSRRMGPIAAAGRRPDSPE